MINTSIENGNKLINFNISNRKSVNEINNNHSSSIIFSSDNFKVIGIKDSTNIKLNKEIIDDYISNKINNKQTPNYMILKYKIDKNKKGTLLFEANFVKKNKSNCKLKINGNDFEFCHYLTDAQIIRLMPIKSEILEIKLEETKENSVTDFSNMFYKCLSLKEVDTEWETSHITDMNHMFYGCESLTSISGISKFNTENVKYMNKMFCHCKNLEYLPYLSNWDIKNVKNISKIFCGCKLLRKLPDISNWKTKNVVTDWFCGCEKLDFLNGISKMDISRITNTNMMFFQCNALKRLPDISESKISKVINDPNINSMTLIYKIKANKGVRLFGTNFIKKNKNNCNIFINGEEIRFCNYLTDAQLNKLTTIKNEILEIKLEEKEKNSITDFSYMF
jgi:surface protein